jgi:tetratricopeptide (TPR) repeat protein
MLHRRVLDELATQWERLPAALLVTGDGALIAQACRDLATDRSGVAVSARCSYRVDGPFAGVSALIYQVVALAEKAGLADLIVAHDSALTLLAPSLAERYPVRYPILTLTVPYRDAVRTFPADFITRAIQGAVDFLFALQDGLGRPALALGLLDLDEAGPLASEFLTILARRAVGRPLLLWASAATGTALPDLRLPTHKLEAPPAPARPLPAAAGPVETRFGVEIWAAVEAGDRAGAVAQINEAATYLLRRGQTKDCLRYAEWAWDLMADQVSGQERWPYLKMLMRAALGAGEFARVEALIAEAQSLPLPPRAQANCLYILSMLHTRYLADRDLAKAISLMEESLAIMETDPELEPGARAFYRNAYALVVMRTGALSDAFAICCEALDGLLATSSPEQYRLHKAILPHNLGRVQAARGNHPSAIGLFTDALAVDPYYADLYLERGLSRLRIGEAEAALDDFARGITYGLPLPQLAAGYGNACIALGRPAEGVTAFTRALELDEGLAQAYKDRALCLYDVGRHQEALSDFDHYLAQRPADADGLVNRSSLRDDLGDQLGALADLEEALRLQPANVAALSNRAILLANLNRWDEALASLDQAIALEPGNELLGQNLALLVDAAAAAKEAG